MNRVLSAAALCVGLYSTTALAAEPEINHCRENDANAEWAHMAEEHRNDDVWQRMFALRIGLCAMVHQDEITVTRADHIFERARSRALKEFRNEPGHGHLGT